MRKITEFFVASGSPTDLAIFRIVLFSSLAYDIADHRPELFPSLPRPFLVSPAKLAWFVDTPLWDSQIAGAAVLILVPAALCAAIGLLTRFTAPLAASLATYLAVLPHFDGKIDHDHHLIWFAWLLAVSPCGDALSIDARNKPIPADSVAYGLPLRFTWILMGLIYFFPGFWKLWTCGPAWALSDNLVNQMYLEWSVRDDWRPTFRIDQYPLLCQLAGIGTLLFELGFIFCIFSPRTRWLAFFGGLAFHNSTNAFLHISFWTLQVCYVSLVPWSKLFSRFRQNSPPSTTQPSGRSAIPIAIVGTILVVGNLIAGGLHALDAYPFACYPTFDYIVGSPVSHRLETAIHFADGRTEVVDPAVRLAPMGAAGVARLQWRILAEKDPGRREQLVRLWFHLLDIPGNRPDVQSVTIDYVTKDLSPDSTRTATRTRLIHLKAE